MKLKKSLKRLPSHRRHLRKIGFSNVKKYVRPHGSKYSEVAGAEKSTDNSAQYLRLTKQEHEMVTSSPLPIESSSHVHGPVFKLLRPLTNKISELDICNEKKDNIWPEDNTYRLVHMGKMVEMWNSVFKEHRETNPECEGYISLSPEGEEKRGVVWREQATCDSCSYVSRRFSLYEEVTSERRGRRCARPNKALQVGLSQTSIGNSSFRRLCLAMNTPAPSEKGMQKTGNVVCSEIQQASENELKERRNELKRINTLRGVNKNVISVECDGVYNNPLYSGVGKTPFQPATQCTYIHAENVTNRKQIIAICNKNKLCSSKGKHRNKLPCGPKNPQCTVTLDMKESIGNEKAWNMSCLEQLKADDLEVQYMTTDADSAAFKAAEEFHKEGKSSLNPESLLDTRHLSANHRKRMKNDSTVEGMMPGKTQGQREKLCNRFSMDMSARCSAEVSAAHKKYIGNINKIIAAMPHTVDAIVECYQGNHKLCDKYSLVCGTKETWISKNAYLEDDFKIPASTITDDKIRACANQRLSTSNLLKTKLNSNTQKSEGMNRSIRRSLPRNVTFSRNFPARAHSAIHSVNNGPGESLVKLCNICACPITPSSRVAKQLKQAQKRSDAHKELQKKRTFKVARCEKRNKLFALYDELKEDELYKKNIRLKEVPQVQARATRRKKERKEQPRK